MIRRFLRPTACFSPVIALWIITAPALLALVSAGCGTEEPSVTPDRIDRFAESLVRFQRDLRIPGMAAAILEDQRVVWSRGFGYADLLAATPATPDTPFQLCSVTKPVAAMLIHQLVEQGDLNLDTPLARYGIELDSAGTVTLRHLMTHTSQGVPGTSFRYHGDRYGYLGAAIRQETGRSFRTLLTERVLDPLRMRGSAPNPADAELLDRFRSFREERGMQIAVFNDKGEEYAIGDPFDPADPLFDQTLNLTMNLLANYFEAAGGGRQEFLRYAEGEIDESTTRDFAEFMNEPDRFDSVYAALARPYTLDPDGNVIPGQYSMFFNPAAGLNSSVLDMAKFDIAMDTGFFVSDSIRRAAFAPTVTAGGDTLPCGLGWFSQEYGNLQLVWHGGEWLCASSLYLKVPARDLTLIIAANARTMSRAFAMGAGSVLESGIGLEFLRIFVYEERFGERGPDIDWSAPPETILENLVRIDNADLRELFAKQVRVMEEMYRRVGRREIQKELVEKVHTRFIPASRRGMYDHLPVIAEIVDVGDDADRRAPFTIDHDAAVRLYAIGEIGDQEAWDRGWIERVDTGEVVWSMILEETTHAGGARRNRLSDRALRLSPGRYLLRYVTDDSHSYMDWHGAVPDHLFWGIRLYYDR